MGRKPKEQKQVKFEMPFYCKRCGKCSTDYEANDNLKITNNTGYTHNIYCKKLQYVVYGI